MGRRHRCEDAGIQNGEAGDGVPRYSGVWGLGFGMGDEHQLVQPPDGKPLIESYGKMALVPHREANGEWKVQQEMWNAAPKP